MIRGTLDRRECIAFNHRDGVVTADLAVNIPDAVNDLRCLISVGRPVACPALPT